MQKISEKNDVVRSPVLCLESTPGEEFVAAEDPAARALLLATSSTGPQSSATTRACGFCLAT